MADRRFLLVFCCLMAVAVVAARPVGRVCGRVVEAGTLEPVGGAELRIMGDTLKCLSDGEGYYEFASVPVGYRIIQAEAAGHELRISDPFFVSTAAVAIVDVAMQPASQSLSEVTVTASPYRISLDAPVSLLRVGAQEIDLTPGANRDISKVLQSMPGVLTVSNSNRNDLLVRGGGANENKYYIDGIEIPVLNHFAVQGGSGGNASLVNTELLQSTDFYTSAFPVNCASGLSSVMSMTLLDGNKERFHGKFVAGFTDAGLHLNTPLSKDGRTTMTVSWRTSYLNMLFGILKLPFLPTYNDYQFKVTAELSPADKVYVLGLGSLDKNRLNTGEKSLEPDREYILGYLPNNDQTSFVFGIGYERRFEGGRLKATASADYLKNRLYKFEGNDESRPFLFDMNSRETNCRGGVSAEWFDVGGFRLMAGVSGGAGVSRNHVFGRYALYASAGRLFLGGRLSANFSLRTDGMTYSALTANPLDQVSPRLNLAYRVSDKLAFSASVARYYQEPAMTLLDYDGRDIEGFSQKDGLRYAAVNHYVLGASFAPDEVSLVKAEGFYKQYANLPVSLLDGMPVTTSDFSDCIVGDVPARSAGKGRAYGVEISWRHLNLWNTVVNASYTFVRSFLNRTGADLQPQSGCWSSPWDVRSIITLSAIHRLGRNWTVGAKWQFSGGLPYTPYDLEKSSRVEAWDARRRPYSDLARFNAMRNPAYHQLDLRVDKIWYFSSWRIGFYVDVQNVYNFKVRGQDILMPENDGTGNYTVDPSRPGHYKMQRIRHDLGGTVLPTVGITVEF